MSKPQGVTASHNSQQQGSNNVQTGQLQNIVTLSLTKDTTEEDFKYGFPSEGLSVASNKWWGSNSPDGEGVHGEAANTYEGNKHQSDKLEDSTSLRTVNQEKCENGKEENNIDPQGTDLLVSVRKGAVEEGKRELKLGVFRGYGAKKLGKREKTLLLRVFKSSMPKQWLPESC